MKPVIVNFDCADHDPIDSWQPSDPSVVDFWMNFTIGTDPSAGDNFQVHIVTKAALSGEATGKHTIVLDRYDWDSVLSEVECLLEQCSGSNWSEISEKLSKHMYWEFENYVPYKR